MIPRRERLVQLARLIGPDAFAAQFGPPHAADPDPERLRALIAEQAQTIAAHLVDEAAASDDVTDSASALEYLDDRLGTLADLLGPAAEEIKTGFREKTAEW